jgi:hypothetical protein
MTKVIQIEGVTRQALITTVGAMAALGVIVAVASSTPWPLLIAFIACLLFALMELRRTAFLALDRTSIQVAKPTDGRYRIDWSDVRYVLTDRTTFAFIGANDQVLRVRLVLQNADIEALRVHINDLTRALGIPVMQTRTEPAFATKNTKLSGAG